MQCLLVAEAGKQTVCAEVVYNYDASRHDCVRLMRFVDKQRSRVVYINCYAIYVASDT